MTKGRLHMLEEHPAMDRPDERDRVAPFEGRPQVVDRGSGAPAAPAPGVRRGRTGWLGWSLLQGARALLPIAIIAVGIAGFQYMRSTKPVPPKRPPQERSFVVATEVAKVGPVRPKLTLYGQTVAGREVELRALVAGRVAETGAGLRDGATVERGAMLLTIDPFDYRSAIRETEAQLAEAKAKLAEQRAGLANERAALTFAREQAAFAESDLKRAEQLSDRGNLADRALDDRRLIVSQRRQAVSQLTNSVDIWQARIGQQEAAIVRLENVLARNRQRLEETTLTAPFDAYVTDVSAQVGRMLGVNDRVATLIDRGAIEVRFTLTDQQYGRLALGGDGLAGRAVRVVWRVGGQEVAYAATIERVAARVASNSGGVDVFARVAEPDGRLPLRTGAFVTVSLDDVRFEDVVAVPASAVYDRSVIYVVENGRLAPRKVEIVGSDGDLQLVRGELRDGDTITVTRLSTPGPGLKVEAR